MNLACWCFDKPYISFDEVDNFKLLGNKLEIYLKNGSVFYVDHVSDFIVHFEGDIIE